MSLPTFCDACKARVEWHVTHAGKSIPINPDPVADGVLAFGPGLKLVVRAPGHAKRMYRCHWDTCPKGNAASKRGLRPLDPGSAADQHERWNCDRDPDDGHRHCFSCGETDHFAGDCPGRVS